METAGALGNFEKYLSTTTSDNLKTVIQKAVKLSADGKERVKIGALIVSYILFTHCVEKREDPSAVDTYVKSAFGGEVGLASLPEKLAKHLATLKGFKGKDEKKHKEKKDKKEKKAEKAEATETTQQDKKKDSKKRSTEEKAQAKESKKAKKSK